MPTLYQLTDEYTYLLEAAESAIDPEERAAFGDTVEALTGEIGQKLENIAKVIAELASRRAAVVAEIDRLKSRSGTIERSIDWLKAYMLTAMKTAGIAKHVGAVHTLAVRSNPPAVAILNENAVPSEFKRTVTTIAIDKRAIGESLKSGFDVPGAELLCSERLDIR